MHIRSYVKETPDGQYRAEIHKDIMGYSVEYFKPTGENFKTEGFSADSVHIMNNVIEKWIDSIETLNG